MYVDMSEYIYQPNRKLRKFNFFFFRFYVFGSGVTLLTLVRELFREMLRASAEPFWLLHGPGSSAGGVRGAADLFGLSSAWGGIAFGLHLKGCELRR